MRAHVAEYARFPEALSRAGCGLGRTPCYLSARRAPRRTPTTGIHAPMKLIFDLDGTLVDSLPGLLAVTNGVLAEEGLPPIQLAQIRLMVGDGAARLLQRAFAAAGGRDPDDAALQRWLSRYVQDATAPPYPGLHKLLRRYPAGALGLCTNKPRAPTVRILKQLGLGSSFGAVVAGDDLPFRKPDPRHLLTTIERLGGGAALYVGDSEVDADTARAAGVPFVAMRHGYSRGPVEELGALAVLDDLGELPEFVASLPDRP